MLYEEGAKTGMMMNVGLHPHVIGVPHRAGLLSKFLAYAKQFDGVWWASREEVAACYRGQHETHIPRGADMTDATVPALAPGQAWPAGYRRRSPSSRRSP